MLCVGVSTCVLTADQCVLGLGAYVCVRCGVHLSTGVCAVCVWESVCTHELGLIRNNVLLCHVLCLLKNKKFRVGLALG